MQIELINILTSPLFYGTLTVTLCGILGLLGFIAAIYAVIEVKALQNSTHSVQYMPIDPKVDKENADYIDQWATSEDSVSEQDKLFKEALEDEMPSFAPNDDDKKKYSF